MSKLNDKQRLFCVEYLKDLNATQAAIRAGYSEKTAGSQGFDLLKKPEIASYISEMNDKRMAKIEIDAQYVLNRLVEIDQMDVADILDSDMSLKPIDQWPKVWRQYLSGFDLSELFEGAGDQREQIGILKKIRWPDKVRNLELLGKHTLVRAFEKDEVTVNNVMHIMPVPTAASVEEWEEAANKVHESNLKDSG